MTKGKQLLDAIVSFGLAMEKAGFSLAVSTLEEKSGDIAIIDKENGKIVDSRNLLEKYEEMFRFIKENDEEHIKGKII